MRPIVVDLEDSIALARAAERAEVSLPQARRLLSELAAMPLEQLARIISFHLRRAR